ncbi:MAG: NAD-dependent epimerase/dehydratase family protein [Planctomycetes bacterium]|nr:NAD-dependent epimerase/dehydratase family protein [Planctomycetota bacterium]
MKVLITGGAGFIGTHTTAALLAAGHEVRILDRLDPQIHGAGSRWPARLPKRAERMLGDVREPSDVARALEGIDAVCHFAAFTGVGQSMYDWASYVATNVGGTACLLEAIVKRGRPLRRFVLASSRAIYGEGAHACAAHGEVHPGPREREALERGDFEARCPSCGRAVKAVPTNEDLGAAPLSLYGHTKAQQEDLCRLAARTFGLPVTILRYFNVYGSGQSLKNPYTGIVSIFYSRLKAGQPIALYERGLPGRDFVHVADVARANVLALESEVPAGTAFNVGSGRELTVRGLAESLAVAAGLPVRFEDRGEFRVGDIRSCFADAARARALLGFRAEVSLEGGLREFALWARGEPSADLYQRSVEELQRHGLLGAAGAAENAKAAAHAHA